MTYLKNLTKLMSLIKGPITFFFFTFNFNSLIFHKTSVLLAYYIFLRIILSFTTLVIYFFKRFKAMIFISNVFNNIYEMDSPICVINLCFTPLHKMWLFMFPLVSYISIANVGLSSNSLFLIVKVCYSDRATLYNALRCN